MGLALVLAYISVNLLSPSDIFPALAPYRINLILAVMSVPLSLVARIQAPEIGKLRTQMMLVILFFGFATCSWFPHGAIGANLAVFLNLAPNVIVYFVGVVQLRSSTRLQFVRATLVIIALFVMVSAYSQMPYARATGETTPYVLASGIEGSTEVRIRGLGMLNDPNIFGQFLLMILPMLFVGKEKTGPRYILAIPIALLLVIGVILTASRGAEMGLAVLFGLFLVSRFQRTGRLAAAIIGPLSMLGINAATSRKVTIGGGMDRLAIWSDGMAFFKHSPVWGIGVGGFLDREDWTAHNSYLLCAAETGILGFFLWMGIMVVTLIQLNRVSKVVAESDPALARWAEAVKLSLGGYLFTSYFLSCTYNLTLFLLLGMAGAIIAAAGGDDVVPVRGTKWQAKSLGLCAGILTLIYVMLRLRVV